MLLVRFLKIKIFKIECNKLAYEEEKMRKQTHVTDTTRRIAGISVFSALAFCVALVTNIPIGFLTFDAKDTIITIASFIYGPVSAVVMSAITALMEAVTVGNTGPWGALMDFISTASFTVTASLIYKYKRNMLGAIIGLISGVFAVTAIMMLANIFITPYYMGVERSVVVSYIPTLLLPFNFTKATLNASITLLIYKPIITAMRRAGVIRSTGSYKPGKKMVIVTVIAALIIAVSLIVFFKVLGAEIKWFQPTA